MNGSQVIEKLTSDSLYLRDCKKAARKIPIKKSNGMTIALQKYYSVSSACGARTADSNFPLWEASQKGMFLLMPQRQSEKAGFASYWLPAPSNSSTSPEILNDPLSFTFIVTFDKISTPFKCDNYL